MLGEITRGYSKQPFGPSSITSERRMNFMRYQPNNPLRKLACFALSNGILFAAFSLLWIAEYHTRGLYVIDRLVVPWGWLAGFFAVSYYNVRRHVALPSVFSAYLSMMLTGLLFCFIFLFLMPIYDPWY